MGFISRFGFKSGICFDCSSSSIFILDARYLDDLLNIDNPNFEGMVNQIYPTELQLNKANTSDTDAALFGIYICLFLTALFHPQFMLNVMTLILIYLTSPF